MSENRNLIIAIALSVCILMGWEYFYGAMATRTGMTQVFELTWLPDRGIVLRLPAANHPEKAAP